MTLEELIAEQTEILNATYRNHDNVTAMLADDALWSDRTAALAEYAELSREAALLRTQLRMNTVRILAL